MYSSETCVMQVEIEAMAASRLGDVYDKVLKLKSRAKDYFKLCMQLAISMEPRNGYPYGYFYPSKYNGMFGAGNI